MRSVRPTKSDQNSPLITYQSRDPVEVEEHDSLTDSHSASSIEDEFSSPPPGMTFQSQATVELSPSPSLLSSNRETRTRPLLTPNTFSAAVLVRRIRPYVAVMVWSSFVLYRATCWFRRHDNDDSSSSLLEDLVRVLSFAREWILRNVLTSIEKGNNSHRLWLDLFRFAWQTLEDVLALLALSALTRVIYIIYHYRWKEDYQAKLVSTLFSWAQDNVSAVQRAIQKQTDDLVQQGDTMLNKDPQRSLTLVLPRRGRSQHDIVNELRNCAATEDPRWSNGMISGTVYNDAITHSELISEVYSIYSWCNPLHPGIWPKVGQCEGEVISMTANMMHAPVWKMTHKGGHSNGESGNLDENDDRHVSSIGCITSGGTESILLAIRAHLNFYGRRRGIQHPELICGSTAHAAVDKACDIYGIRQIIIDCNDGDTFQLDSQKVRNSITSNTIMIYASAPCYPQGVIDPISQLSDLAVEFDVGLHVDACLGGFVLPFLGDGEVPVFDFRNPGVTSMSADTHKYGYASKGTSVVLYRCKELRHGQYFCYPHWTGGMYTTPTFAGSRPGALSACAWAAMISIGEDGYRERALAIFRAARKLAHGIDEMPGLKLLTKNPYMVVCFGVDENENRSLSIYRVQDMMKERGWALNAMQSPASIHMCVTLNVVPKVNELLKDLKLVVVQAHNEGSQGKCKGTAGIYGTVGSVPPGAVVPTLQAFTDLTLAP